MFRGFPKHAFPKRAYPTGKIGNVGVLSDSDASNFCITAGITDLVEREAIYFLVTELKRVGLWRKMRAIYPIRGSNSSSASFNLVNPARFRITWINSPTFAFTGVLGNGINQYGNTGFVQSANLSASNTSFSFYARNSGAGIGIGTINGAAQTFMFTQSGGQVINSGVPTTFASAPSNTGLFFSTKGAANINRAFHNGVLRSVSSVAVGNASPSSMGILAALNNTTPVQFCTQEGSFAHIGEHLEDAEVTVFYSIVQQYHTILGIQV